MKIIVTGSLGYIGSVLTDYLSRGGFDVIGWDTGFFKDCLLYSPAPIKTIFKDVRDMDASDLDGIEAVVHLAGISNDPFGDLEAAKVYDPTRDYSLRLAKICKKVGSRFIFASSCSVYGQGGNAMLTEDSPVNPQTPYSLNKVQIEDDLRSLSDKDFSPIALRLATVFGLSPRMRFDVVINMLVGMALTSGKLVLNSDGTPWRPNIYILDALKAIRFALASDYNQGKLLILNVGADENNLQVIEIAGRIQNQVPGCELKFLAQSPELDERGLVGDRKVRGGVDTRDYRVSFSKIKRYFKGFSCDWSVDRGIQQMLAELKKLALTNEQFKNINFYRLQKMDELYKNGYLGKDLRWLK